MNKRAGARRIDGKKTKKERRQDRLRELEKSKNKNEVRFNYQTDGLWAVVSDHESLSSDSNPPELGPTNRFNLKEFLNDVRSSISHRNGLVKIKS